MMIRCAISVHAQSTVCRAPRHEFGSLFVGLRDASTSSFFCWTRTRTRGVFVLDVHTAVVTPSFGWYFRSQGSNPFRRGLLNSSLRLLHAIVCAPASGGGRRAVLLERREEERQRQHYLQQWPLAMSACVYRGTMVHSVAIGKVKASHVPVLLQ